jgi:hypothetical protein
MRGGSIPLLAMATALTAALAVNWIWTSDTIQVASFAFAVIVLVSGAAALAWTSRGDSIRRGPPPPSELPETLPTSSLGAVAVAIAVGAVMFGLAFGRFLVFFGAGLLVAALGRLAVELRAQRRASERARSERTEGGR